MTKHQVPAVPEAPDGDLDWGEFFGPLDPELVFECNSTVFGRYDSVCVYRDLIVIESPFEAGSEVEIPVRRITGWRVEPHSDAARLTIWADEVHSGRLPVAFARALSAALLDVVGSDRMLHVA